MMDVLGGASVGSAWIPDLLFCLYQLMFAMYSLIILETDLKCDG